MRQFSAVSRGRRACASGVSSKKAQSREIIYLTLRRKRRQSASYTSLCYIEVAAAAHPPAVQKFHCPKTATRLGVLAW